MKKTFILMILCMLINACSRPSHVIEITVEKDGAKIKVVASQTEMQGAIQQTLHSTIELTVEDNGMVTSNEGDTWTSINDAISDSKRMAKAQLEATLEGLKELDKQ